MAFGSRAGGILLALLWLWLFAHLQQEWSLNSQYNYGWAVPFLGLLIFCLRWRHAPRMEAPLHGSRGATITIWVLLSLLFPIRVIEEANPDWRFLSWFLALDVVALSLLWSYRAGGLP